MCEHLLHVPLKSIATSGFSQIFGAMKNQPPRFLLCLFYGETNFHYSEVEITENVVISDRTYTILEIMSTKGYRMWTNELSP